MQMTNQSTLLVLLAACVLGGCATLSNDLSDAASRLDRSTDVLSDEVRSTRDSTLQREADRLAEVAEDFNGDVQERVVREELRARFERVADRYHELRDELKDERSASMRERTAFNDVTRAYLDLERELQYRGVSRRERSERNY